MNRTKLALAVGLLVLAGSTFAKKPPPPAADPEIAYVESGRKDTLCVADADGSNETELLSASMIGRPNWCPDGDTLVFESDVQGDGVYTINIDGTGLTKVVSKNWALGRPVWSPVATDDGEFKIAFSDRTAQGDADIFLVNLDGTGLQNLTNTPDIYESQPTWAPSADRLAINDVTNDDIVVYDLDLVDGELAIVASLNLTSDDDVPDGVLNDSDVSGPDWAKTQDAIILHVVGSPDVNGGSNLGDLWVIDLDDPANPVNITNTPDTEERHATYSPDDLSVAFHKNGRKDGIYVMDADGGSMSQIVSRAGLPDWRRNP
jgi:Tol biopolymer transport system component